MNAEPFCRLSIPTARLRINLFSAPSPQLKRGGYHLRVAAWLCSAMLLGSARLQPQAEAASTAHVSH